MKIRVQIDDVDNYTLVSKVIAALNTLKNFAEKREAIFYVELENHSEMSDADEGSDG
jgi:hypothetical protein